MNTPWLLLGVSILLGFISVFIKFQYQQKITKSKVLKQFHNAFDFVIGIYALIYATFVIAFNIAGVPATLPQDDTTLTLALFYGGIHIIHPYLTDYFKLRNKIRGKVVLF